MLTQTQYDELYKKFTQESNSNAIAYIVEINSLFSEIYYLDIINKKEIEPLLTSYGINNDDTFIKYVIYAKDIIYRVYDFLNKYSLFLGSIKENQLYNLEKWQSVLSNLPRLTPELRNIIEKVKEEKNLKEVLKSRTAMSHKKLIQPNQKYISSLVLPLNGESASDRKEWINESSKILEKSIENIEELFDETVRYILK